LQGPTCLPAPNCPSRAFRPRLLGPPPLISEAAYLSVSCGKNLTPLFLTGNTFPFLTCFPLNGACSTSHTASRQSTSPQLWKVTGISSPPPPLIGNLETSNILRLLSNLHTSAMYFVGTTRSFPGFFFRRPDESSPSGPHLI